MKHPRLHPSFILAAVLAVFLLAAARAEEAATTVKFSQPGKPGTLKVVLAHGDLRVQGTDTNEVTVKSESKAVTKAPRKDGLRVLTASSSFALSEKENVVTLDAMSDGWAGGHSDFRVTVPRGTSIVVRGGWGGDITCTNIAGDIEVKSTNGEIQLDDVSGGLLIETMNGDIRANVRELHDGKPLSFASTNGEVVIRVPTDARANVRLRTQNGAVLTDFNEQALVTKTETTMRPGGRTMNLTGRRVVLPPEARDAIRESVKAVTLAGREIRESIQEGLQASARERSEVDRARAEVDRARVEIEREVVRTTRAPVAVAAVPAVPPVPGTPAAAPVAPAAPAAPALPTITGGKLVTGKLNGGGPEISVATMNGDVTLRQLEKK